MSMKYHGYRFLTRILTAQPHESLKGVIQLGTRFQLLEAGKLFIAIKDLVDITSYTIPIVAVAGCCWTNSHSVLWIQGYLVNTWCRKARTLVPFLKPENTTGEQRRGQ